MKAIRGYICDTCKEISIADGSKEAYPWKCPVCNKETCSHCFSIYAVCKTCAKTMTKEECKKAANSKEWDFE